MQQLKNGSSDGELRDHVRSIASQILAIAESLRILAGQLIDEPEYPIKDVKLPHELSSPQAIQLLHSAQEEGLLDERLQPRMSRTRLAILAELIGDQLELKARWRPFEVLWDFRKLGHYHTKALCMKSYNEIRRDFKKKLRTSPNS